MMLSLLFGVHEPMIGMMGSIIFSAATFGYLVSPVFNDPGNLWGARKRMEDMAPMPEDEEEEVYEDY